MKESTVIHLKGPKEPGDKAEAGKRRASEAAHSIYDIYSITQK